MDRHIHFISGLPRSGSTLLSALLQQNPRFHAGLSSPVAGMFTALLHELSGQNELSVFINDAQRQRILRGLFANYHDGEIGDDVVFDTNRTWCARLPALKTLFPDARIIACVRNTAWIVDSIERLIRNNAFQPSSIFNYQPGGTVYSRVEGLVSGDGMVGHAYNALKEAYFGEETGKMLLQYDTPVNEPACALAAVYDFIGEPSYAHDLQHVSFDDQGFDQRAGTPGLHRVRARVGATARQSILPPDLFRRFENDPFWRDPQLDPRGVRIV
jgi:sulfotransferase